MPRKGYIAKRDVLPDPIYNSKLITKLINKIMIDGKRGTAQTIYTMHSLRLRRRQARTQWKYSKRLSAM